MHSLNVVMMLARGVWVLTGLAVVRAWPTAPLTTDYRLYVASCGTAQLQPLLLSFGTSNASGVASASATLSPFGNIVPTVGTASKWVVSHPHQDVLYTVNSAPEDGVSAFSVGSNGQTSVLTLALPNVTNMTAGFGLVHLQPSPGGHTLVIAGYGSGTVAAARIDGSTGHFFNSIPQVHQFNGTSACKMMPAAARQTAPHPHSVARFEDSYYVSDLGLDKVSQLSVDDTTGTFTIVHTLEVETCSGPRHMTFHPSGKFAYILHEMGNTVAVHPRDVTTGYLSAAVKTYSTLPVGWGYCANITLHGTGNCSKAAEVRVTASGGTLFASNRGHNSIVAFKIADAGARLELLGWPATGLVWPRGFELTPDSTALVAMSNSQPGLLAPEEYPRVDNDDWAGSVVVYAVDETIEVLALSNGRTLLTEVARLDVANPCSVHIEPMA